MAAKNRELFNNHKGKSSAITFTGTPRQTRGTVRAKRTMQIRHMFDDSWDPCGRPY